MTRRPTLRERAARWSLLIAALLHFGTAVVGAYSHASSLSLLFPTAAVLQQTGGTDADAPVPHDELGCAVCQSLVTLGLPTARSTDPLDSVLALRIVPERLHAVNPTLGASVHARAPPAV